MSKASTKFDDNPSKLSALIYSEIASLSPFPIENWLTMLTEAYRLSTPVYGCDWYRELFFERCFDINWYAKQLLSAAVEEAEGVRRLNLLAATLPTEMKNYESKIRRHADDERRHCSIFLDIIRQGFPNLSYADSINDEMTALLSATPATARTIHIDAFISEMVQINIGEIKNYVNVRLMASAAHKVFSLAENDALESRITPLFTILARDELQHIRYTADIIEQLSHGDSARQLAADISEIVQLFNAETLKDLRFDIDPESAKLTYGAPENLH